jgi:hypothetical protein
MENAMSQRDVDLQFYGIDKLQLKLQQMQRRASENMSKRVIRASLKPTLAEIKRLTPVKSGALQKSLVIQVLGGQQVRGFIWPGKTFQLGTKALGVTRFRKGAAGVREGRRRNQSHPLTYVAQIETQHAHMIAKGRSATKHTTLGLLRSELRRELGL